ncbi:TPA: hypothetical protein ACOO1X_002268 [Streptococcus pneumoniae]
MSINEWSAHGQSDSNLGHKGQARWRTPEQNPIAILDVRAKRWQTPE